MKTVHKGLKKKKWLILQNCVQWAFGGKKTIFQMENPVPASDGLSFSVLGMPVTGTASLTSIEHHK